MVSFSADRQFTNPLDSDISTRDTVKQMYKIVNTYTTDPSVINAVNQALKGLASNELDRVKISKIFYWIKSQIKFKDDVIHVADLLPDTTNPEDKELLIAPDLLLKLKLGDCDCFSMLASAMLRNIGLPTKFVTIAANKQAPNMFSHIYLEVFDRHNQVWIPFDCSHGNKPDWEYTNTKRRYTWEE